MRIKNGLVFTGEHKMEKRDLFIEDGVIAEESRSGELSAEGCYVLPGFIDTHIHGAFGCLFYSSERRGDIRPMLDSLCERGVTSVLATFATESLEDYMENVDNILRAEDDRVIGIHCEGPFVNPCKKGGLRAEDVKLPDIRIPLLINERSGGALKIVTIAPEVEGALEVIEKLSEMGINVSLGHTDATASEAYAAIDRGATRVTHTYNAMRPLGHRDPGILGVALSDDRVTCELICDLHHVSAEAVKLLVRAKGADRVTMISDSSFFAGLPEGEYKNGSRILTVKGGFARLPDGTISGSACTLADGARNMFSLGFSPEEIAVMACVNPARAAGATDRGELIPGYRADVVILDSSFEVKHVFVRGVEIR